MTKIAPWQVKQTTRVSYRALCSQKPPSAIPVRVNKPITHHSKKRYRAHWDTKVIIQKEAKWANNSPLQWRCQRKNPSGSHILRHMYFRCRCGKFWEENDSTTRGPSVAHRTLPEWHKLNTSRCTHLHNIDCARPARRKYMLWKRKGSMKNLEKKRDGWHHQLINGKTTKPRC